MPRIRERSGFDKFGLGAEVDLDFVVEIAYSLLFLGFTTAE